MSATLSYRTEFESCYIQDSELHAHRYKIEVTVDGERRYHTTGQIIDYKELATYVKSICPDKTFLTGMDSTPSEQAVAVCMKACSVPVMERPHQLTIESFCESLARELQDLLDRHAFGVRVVEVKLRETNDSYATWIVPATE